MLNQRNPRVNNDQFSMVPRADIPRATFSTRSTHKTTFDGTWLIPVFVKEILPGDSIYGRMTFFTRIMTLIFPLMDHVTLESFFFFGPSRLLWTNFVKMMGAQDNPTDSISYIIPTLTSPAGGYAPGSLQDYMGLPVEGQMGAAATKTHNVLPLRLYNFIWKEWFRDENLQASTLAPFNTGDGPDALADYGLIKRAKKKDYITSALPWPLKGGVEVRLPLTGNAPVLGLGAGNKANFNAAQPVWETGGGNPTYDYAKLLWNGGATNDDKVYMKMDGATGAPLVYADMSQVTGATIAALRLAVQTQRLLERDARGGTRYTEHLQAHWGVMPEDARLQRPEYIGGGKSSMHTQAIPQTSDNVGGTPQGNLAGAGTISGEHTFSYQAKEHGYILGLVNVDAEITYMQGIHRMWTRSTRFDFYIPVLAHLSEQAIRLDEVYVQGTIDDDDAFGYQERWAEYRYDQSHITGMFRSTTTGNIDEWHLAQQFASAPVLNGNFISSSTPFSRALAAGGGATNMQFLFDSLFDIRITRAMPMRSVPGGMDRF